MIQTLQTPIEKLQEALRGGLRPDRTLVVGLVGAPGAGKSTLAAALTAAMAAQPDGMLYTTRAPESGRPLRALTVSLDDFYFEPAERHARGLPFRGPPGTHDIERLDRFLAQ